MATYLMAGILVFCRIIGFFRFAPIFSRKDFPALVKLPLAIIISIYLLPALSPEKVMAQCDSLMLSILLNFAVGAMLGYMAQLITLVVDAGAEMIASQMGLQPGSILDPVTSSSSQASILTTVMSLIGILVFINAVFYVRYLSVR
jgi:flagellar biosynthetic protein FliR